MQEPHACQTSEVGEQVKLSTDLIFEIESTNEKVKYEWWVDDEKIIEDDDCYKISDTGVLSIHEFEKCFEGQYLCILSTVNEPIMSVSTQVQLCLTGKEIYRQYYVYLQQLRKYTSYYRSSTKI